MEKNFIQNIFAFSKLNSNFIATNWRRLKLPLIKIYSRSSNDGYLWNVHKKQIARAFAPSALNFAVAASLAVIYFTDWKVVTKHLPIYNTKYPKDK